MFHDSPVLAVSPVSVDLSPEDHYKLQNQKARKIVQNQRGQSEDDGLGTPRVEDDADWNYRPPLSPLFSSFSTSGGC